MFHPITVIEVADMNSTYPEMDIGIGVNYALVTFRNSGYARIGPFIACDLNPNLSTPDWFSIGGYISREIQYNVTLGTTIGWRFIEYSGFQWGMFVGIDIVPWLF